MACGFRRADGAFEALALVPAGAAAGAAVATLVRKVCARSLEVHPGAVGIARVHFQHHSAAPPRRGVEVVKGAQARVLRRGKHVAQVEVAAAEDRAGHVAARAQGGQVVEVDFIRKSANPLNGMVRIKN